MSAPPSRAAGAVLLALLTLAAYSSSLGGGFLWDDDAYVVDNKTLTEPDGLRSIWLDPVATPQYYPLVHTTFWAERRLWGLDPRGYRAVNLALHLAAALMLWAVLAESGVPWPWLAAGLFALHPVHAESVAWVTERKNVLSAALALSSAWCYLRVLREPPGARRALLYAASGLLFVGGLLSKTVVCSLPAALLVLLWRRSGRVKASEALPLAPFFAAGLALALVTAGLERTHVGARGADWDLSAAQRVLVAGRAAWFYAGKLAWPQPLVFIYPRWTPDAARAWQWLFPVSAAGLVALLWARRERWGRGPLAAALYFGGTLVPALGFFDVYPMRFSFVADHFQYLASCGPLALAAAGFARAAASRPRVARGAAAAVLVAFGSLTFVRGRTFTGPEALWGDTLAKNPGCWMCLSNLAELRSKEGRPGEAVELYRRLLARHPDHTRARNNLGALLIAAGDLDGAEENLRAALALTPDHAGARSNLGAVLYKRGRLEESIVEFTAAARLDPALADARENLAAARAELERRRRRPRD
ncbi:tetratricopeptide repeat protein [bacterium]|nr:MAG: tetratricopeptide repeat protein [bacterium]